MTTTNRIATTTTINRIATLERVLRAGRNPREQDLAWLSGSARRDEVARRAALPQVSDERKAAIAARVAARLAK